MAQYWVLFRALCCGGSLLPLVLASTSAQAAPLPVLTAAEATFSEPPANALPGPELPPVDLSAAFVATLGADASPGAAVSLDTLTFSPAALALESAEVPGADSPGSDSSAAPSAAGLMPLVSATVSAPLHPTAAEAAPLAQVRPAPEGDDWEYVIQPYLFVPLSVRATANVSGVEQSVSAGLGDIFNLDRVLAGALRFEARNPQYGFFTDLSYVYAREGRSLTNFPLPQVVTDPLSLVSPVPIPPGTPASVTATATSRATTLDLGGFYRVVDQRLTNSATYPRLLVDPLAGLRVIFLSGSIDFGNIAVAGLPLGGRSLSRSATLVQPIIGAQASLELSERWAVGLRGDVGGFGLGADENLSWNILLGTRYSFNSNLALQLAYRFTELRYSQGQGSDRFGLTQSQNGLWVGLDIGL
ncbi:hypothetical protein ACQ4N7_15365 [Nodosilinea sp. AN01ver1]|uniref:hypothetical protein n=1 Tax=Nodosilinea sp. AN01ver1 TaxID=3423362 RepID=UPI003D321D18